MTGKNGVVGVKYLNDVAYTTADLKIFAEEVCDEINLRSLKKFLTIHDYSPFETKDLIYKLSKGITPYEYTKITESARQYHEQLFDVMYIKNLIEMPLLINHGDPDIIPVVKWRLKVAK